MDDTRRREVLAAIPELLFATRVSEAARLAGVGFTNVALTRLAVEAAERRPDLVLVDLTAPGDPAAAIAALRAVPELASLRVIGFYPHVHDGLRVAALAAGATAALPRSAFTSRLGEVLAGTYPAEC